MKSLSGKNVLITGGATGIGWGIARGFADAECNVAISGRRDSALKTALDSWDGNEIRSHVVDVTDRESVDQLFTWFRDQIGQVDILVNSAGTNIKTRSMAEMTPDQWDHVMAINATGAYNAMYAALAEMRERGNGLIVNISSIAGKRALDLGGIAYCASKFAATALGTAAGQEVAKDGVRITNVYPGEVETPILDNRPTPVSDERRAAMLQPEDVADMVVALATLPPRAHVPEIIIKPTVQSYC